MAISVGQWISGKVRMFLLLNNRLKAIASIHMLKAFTNQADLARMALSFKYSWSDNTNFQQHLRVQHA